MKGIDVKRLWGRAANRCSFPQCKMELTAEGDTSTIGEMAHIISKKEDGPRGQGTFQGEDKDSYENRILLCPTHHTLIDRHPEEWTVDSILAIKNDHERWVEIQLDNNTITFHSIDNSVFLEERISEITAFHEEKIWLMTFITPLNISSGVINTRDQGIIDIINSYELQNQPHLTSSINRQMTRPNSMGLVNDDLRLIDSDIGHVVQICRNGHCEIRNIVMPISAEHITDRIRTADFTERGDELVLSYSEIALKFVNQIQNLKKLWDDCLQFKDMLISALILNTNNTRLVFGISQFGEERGGNYIQSNKLDYSFIVDKKIDWKEISELVMMRMVENFGLVLDSLYTDDSNLCYPRFLRS